MNKIYKTKNKLTNLSPSFVFFIFSINLKKSKIECFSFLNSLLIYQPNNYYKK